MRDVIFVSLENWDDIWRRNQFVCAELARRHPQMRILFVGWPRNVSHALRHGRLKRLLRRATYSVPGVANITVTHPWKLLPDSLPGGRAVNAWLFRQHVRGVSLQLGFDRPVLWLNPHSAVHMAGRMGEAAVIYDVTDDWTSFSHSPRVTELTRRQDAELCAKADAVIVCSQRLLDMKREMAKSVHLIPNGVDAGHYSEVLHGTGPLPEAAAQWIKPVYGYTGSVHPDRVDVELVREFAQRVKGTVVLLGPDMLPPQAKARLALPNVVIFGPVPYAQVPAYMRAFDVCIVPHRMSAFTESLNPIKLWEYLAAGKPIVSTDVAGFRDYPKLVRLARTADELVAAAHAALAEAGIAEGESLAAQRQAIARENSWQQRVDEIERVIEECLIRRGQTPGTAILKDVVHAG